jgi:transcriptional regulator with XRE-family HTH domain
MTIGERIKHRRKQIGMSVDELAQKLGKNRTTIYRYESDEIENLPLNVLEPLAKILNVSPGYLMGWEDFNIRLIQSNFDGVKAWSNNKLLSSSEKSIINMHFAELLGRYKELINSVVNAKPQLHEFEKFYSKYNKTLEEPLSPGNIKDKFWSDNLEREIDGLIAWINTFTKHLSGVYNYSYETIDKQGE